MQLTITENIMNQYQLKDILQLAGVSELCDVKSHVLGYWEQEFPSLSPVKEEVIEDTIKDTDVLLIRQIRSLLYEQGYTIEGARKKSFREMM